MASVDDCSGTSEKNGKAVLADDNKIEKDGCLEDSQSSPLPAKVDGPTLDSPTYWEQQEMQQKEQEEIEMKSKAETELQNNQGIKRIKRKCPVEELDDYLKKKPTQ